MEEIRERTTHTKVPTSRGRRKCKWGFRWINGAFGQRVFGGEVEANIGREIESVGSWVTNVKDGIAAAGFPELSTNSIALDPL